MNTSYWTRLQGTPTVNTWLGLAYERVCMAHISQIKRALGIGSVVTEAYSWRSKDPEHPAAIQTHYGIVPTLITTFGLSRGMYADSIHASVVLDDLFSD